MRPFSPALVAPYFVQRDNSVNVLATTDKIVIPFNIHRVYLAVSASIPGIFFRPNSAAANQTGFQLPNSGQPLEFSFADSGILAASEWHAFSPAGPGSVYYVEIVYYPTGD